MGKFYRTIKNNHMVSTYYCNGGYISEIFGKYGQSEKVIFSSTTEEAERIHYLLLRSL